MDSARESYYKIMTQLNLQTGVEKPKIKLPPVIIPTFNGNYIEGQLS